MFRAPSRFRPSPWVIVIALLPFAPGCRHSNPSPAAPLIAASDAPTAGSAASSVEGDVAVRFLADPATPEIKVAEDEEFAPASPRFMPLPMYPAAALQERGPAAIVAVRLHLDAGGFVTAVTDSPRLSSSTGPHSAEFRQAVEAAVRRWSFSPARVDTVAPITPAALAAGEQRPLKATRYVPTFLDFAFQFAVVDGQGAVSLGTSSTATPTPSPK